jgi:hypothetical protein
LAERRGHTGLGVPLTVVDILVGEAEVQDVAVMHDILLAFEA